MPHLKDLLADPDRVLRFFAVGRLPHPVLIDMLGASGGWDGIWLDQEHVGLTTEQVTTLNLAARANDLACFVRAPFTHYSVVSQNLESGVDGVMAARINGADDAVEFVRWCKFTPEGWRGVNTSGADAGYTKLKADELAASANARSFVAVQIETLQALKEVAEIAATPHIDLLFIGPNDLSAELGHIGRIDHPDVWAAIESIAAACRENGKPWGVVPAGPRHAERCVELGCRLVTVGNDGSTVRLGLDALKQAFAGLPSKV